MTLTNTQRLKASLILSKERSGGDILLPLHPIHSVRIHQPMQIYFPKLSLKKKKKEQKFSFESVCLISYFFPGCYPFTDRDPFLIETCPHVYFVGNQDKYDNRLLKGTTSFLAWRLYKYRIVTFCQTMLLSLFGENIHRCRVRRATGPVDLHS